MMFYVINRYFKICYVGELTFSYKIRGVELSMLCYVKDSYFLQFYNSKFIFPRNVWYIWKNAEAEVLFLVCWFLVCKQSKVLQNKVCKNFVLRSNVC